jgi:lysophospholipase L1-like esterase
MDVTPASSPASGRARDALLSKPVGAFAVAMALVGLAYLIPGAERFRLLSPKPVEESTVPAASDSAAAPIGEVKLVDETTDRPELAVPSLPPAERTKKPPVPIDDPSGKALDPFFKSLVAIERKEPGTLVRIVHYGDSLLAVDFVSGTLRRKLQDRFGDAGHGYMPVANPWPGYFHNDVFRRASTEWMVSRVVGPFAGDQLYGLGGVTLTGYNRAAWAQYGTSTKTKFGNAVSRFGVQYLEQPKGGTFEILIDKKQTITVDTKGDQPALRERVVKVPDGEHQFEVRVAKGPVRAFGTWMERDVPGVVLDSIGIQGGRLRFLDQSNDEHWAQALRMRNPNLVVFEFGLNESADGFAYPLDRYRETTIEVLKQVRKALPNASCLVVALNDVAKRQGAGLVTAPVVPHLVKIQREVAAEVGCAFFDTYKAMGGNGSMAAWIGRGLGQSDLTHPTTVGADIIGSWVFQALMDAYEPYRAGPGTAPPSAASSATPAP